MESAGLASKEADTAVDMNALAELRDIMGEDFEVLLPTFFTDSEKKLTEIRVALQQADFESVKLLAHSLKGSSSNLYAAQLRHYCYQLEQSAPDKDAVLLHSLLEKVEAEYQVVKQALQSLG